MRSALALLAVPLLAGCGGGQPAAEATPTPSTRVSLVPARQGSLPSVIEGFGQAAPASNGVATISLAQPGQVTAVPVVAGATVRAGQPIAVFAVAPSARSTYLQAVDAVKAAQAQRATTAQLLTEQLATRDQLVQADKAVADARVTQAALAREGAGAAVQTLRAPFAGTVSLVTAAPGDRTQPGQALATVARAGAVVVTVGVDPARRAELRIGAPVTLTRLDGGPAIAGRVRRVDAMLNPRTRQVDVDIEYPTGALLAGEAVRVGIETGRAAGWLVPHRAVVIGADGKAHVFQTANGKARAVPVTVLASRDNEDVVAGALDARAGVIVDGAYQLAGGDAIRVGR